MERKRKPAKKLKIEGDRLLGRNQNKRETRKEELIYIKGDFLH